MLESVTAIRAILLSFNFGVAVSGKALLPPGAAARYAGDIPRVITCKTNRKCP
jgi:hypothetical protein